MSHDVVCEGDTIIVKMHDEHDTMIKVISSIEQKIGKGRVDVSPIVGANYGSVFEIRGRKLVKLDDTQIQNEGNFIFLLQNYFILLINYYNYYYYFLDLSILSKNTITGDNRSFTDTNTAQKLTDFDIHQLRDQGASAKDIISSLINNSETWNNKTEFSQEKWLIRKQKK